jgi:hypothetical protein
VRPASGPVRVHLPGERSGREFRPPRNLGKRDRGSVFDLPFACDLSAISVAGVDRRHDLWISVTLRFDRQVARSGCWPATEARRSRGRGSHNSWGGTLEAALQSADDHARSKQNGPMPPETREHSYRLRWSALNVSTMLPLGLSNSSRIVKWLARVTGSRIPGAWAAARKA